MLEPVNTPSGSSPAARLVKTAHIALMAAIFVVMAFLFGGVLIETGQKIYYGWASLGWPAKIGTVVTSHVEETRKSRIPHVSYRYEVGGRVIHSERLGNYWAYGNGWTHDAAYNFVRAFPAGAEVLVYHHPGGEVSVLERGVRFFDIFGFIIMLPFTAFVLWLPLAGLVEFITLPAAEQLARWRAIRDRGRRRPRVQRTPYQSRARMNALMEVEIAERQRELAARKTQD